MRQTSRSSTRGFSLIELMLALALGLLITGAAVKLYSTGVDATWVIQQRAEMQQDLRAAENLILRDVSLAGAGLTQVPGETIALPFVTTPIYGCSTGAGGPVCPPNGAINYPCVGGACAAATPPTLYAIMPGYQLGIKPPGSAIPSDIITVVYSDTNLALSCYTSPAMTTSGGGTVLTFTAPSLPLPGGCVLPPNVPYPQALNNNVNGLIPGDVVLLHTSTGWAVGEVTAVAPAYPTNNPPVAGTSTYSITFGNGDTLKLNQAAQTNDLSQVSGGANPQAWRIYVITYYLQNWTDAAGLTTTILYRQVNGQAAVPLVDNIANMQFTYDTYNTDGTLLNATGDGGESIGIAPSSIRKVNILHLTIHGQLYGTRSSLMATQGFQSFDVQTSISARNMSFSNRY